MEYIVKAREYFNKNNIVKMVEDGTAKWRSNLKYVSIMLIRNGLNLVVCRFYDEEVEVFFYDDEENEIFLERKSYSCDEVPSVEELISTQYNLCLDINRKNKLAILNRLNK